MTTAKRATVASIFVCLAVLAAGIGVLAFIPHHGKKLPAHVLVETNDPYKILSEANRLSWLMNFPAAAPLYRRAETMFHALGDQRNEAYAHVGELATQTENMPRSQLSEALANELKSPIIQSDPELRLWCLVTKANVDIEYNPASAERLWTEALEMARKLRHQSWMTRAEGMLGILALLVDGKRVKATKLFGRALFATMLNGDTAGQIQFLGILGNALNDARRYAEALVLFERAIKLARENPDVGSPFLSYQGKAEALLGQGRVTESKQILEHALALAESERNGTDESVLRTFIGKLNIQAGDYKSAIRELQSAAQIAEQLNVYRVQAEANFELANLYTAEGSISKATACLARAVNASRSLGDLYFPPKEFSALAALNARLGNLSKSDSLFRHAEDLIDGRLKGLNAPYWRTGVREAFGDSYVQHFKVATRKGNIAEAMEIIERVRSRATALDSGTIPQSDDRYSTKSIERQIEDIQLKLMQSQPSSNQSELEDKLSLLEQHLALDSNSRVPTHHANSTTPASLRTIQNVLHKNEGLLEYVLDEPVSFCIAVTRRKASVVALKHGKAKIEALADDYISQIRSKKSVSALGKYLYSVLLPGSLLPPQSTRLIVIPDGKLHFLPFESLVDSTGEFLLQSHVLSYASSATLLLSLRTKSRYPKPHRALLALGGVSYQDPMDPVSVSASRGFEQLFGVQLRNLPSTKDEVVALSKLFTDKTTLLVGASATETTFKAQPLADFKILHLAVHAIADAHFPDRAALILGQDKNSNDDGLLQVREITVLPLKADLVTLSACETAFGKLEGEEGVNSLEEAFLLAGARSVLATLWNVEDRATTTLMESFYAHLALGEDEATSLTRAKLEFMHKHENQPPFYWAGFVLVGEGSSTPFQ